MWGKISILTVNLMMWSNSVFAHGDEGGDMMGGGHMMDFRYGGVYMLIILVILIGVIVYFVLQKGQVKGRGELPMETPMEILKRRYAKGEISKDEYEKMRNCVTSDPLGQNRPKS